MELESGKFCQWQADDKDRALSRNAAFDGNAAAVLLDDRMTDREPQAGTLTARPMGKKGIKYPRQIDWQNPATGIAHAHQCLTGLTQR